MNEAESRLTIEEVLDLETGEIIKSKDFFKQSEDKLIQFRRIQQEAINNNTQPKFVCPYCYQTLKISGKATQRGMVSYFAHLYDSDDCEIKTNGSYSLEEIEALKYAGVKESQRHIHLKEKLYQFLTSENSQKLLVDNVKLEKRINSGNPLLNWRQPDVYAEYNNRKIVFELQLSTTFLSVIVARDNFYKLNDTYIIWVFNFSDNTAFVNLGNLMCKDIYYANKRNAFILDNEAIRLSEQEKQLVLLCKWFEPVVKDGKVVANKEKQEYIKLSNLQFDDKEFKPYYIDADNLFLEYNPEQLINRKNQEVEQEKWLKIVEAKAIERTNKKEILKALKIEKIKKELLQGKYKLKPIKLDNKWGYKAHGEIIVPPIYDFAYPPDEDGYVKVMNNNKFGYLDQVGREVLRCIYDDHYYRSDLAYEKSLLEKENSFLIKEHKLHKWIKHDLTGITDENDKEIIPFIFDEISLLDNNIGIKAKKNGFWGYFDLKGNEVIANDFQLLESLGNSAVKVCKEDLWGIIDLQGQEIVPCIYNSIGDFINEMCAVRYNNKTGYINIKGEEIISPVFDFVDRFIDGKAKTKKGSFWGYVRENGDEIIKCIYQQVELIDNGFYKVKLQNKWGFLDNKGNELTQCIYDNLWDFKDDVAPVLRNNLYGYINKEGYEIIPCAFNGAGYFKNNKAKVKKSNYWGYIDKKGNEIIPFKYEDISNRNNGFYMVKLQGKLGYLNETGKIVVDIIYDWISDFNENITEIKQKDRIIQIRGLAKYKHLNRRGYVNKNGKEYWQYWKE